MKSTPVRGMKKNLKSCTYKRWEHYDFIIKLCVTACLLHNEPATYCALRVKSIVRWSQSESECEMRKYVVHSRPETR